MGCWEEERQRVHCNFWRCGGKTRVEMGKGSGALGKQELGIRSSNLLFPWAWQSARVEEPTLPLTVLGRDQDAPITLRRGRLSATMLARSGLSACGLVLSQ